MPLPQFISRWRTLADETGTAISASNPLPIAVTSASGGYVDRSVANMTGSSQTLMAANADRQLLLVHNIGSDPVGVNLAGGTASLTVGGNIVLLAGGVLLLDNCPPVGAITVIGTLNGDLTAYEA